MKVLITGVNGQLGYDVVRRLGERGIACKGVDIADFDLTDVGKTAEGIKAYMPDAVVHCAAFTAVDAAEEKRDLCRAVNVSGTRNVAAACAAIDAKMVYISTDYVFAGRDSEPFMPDSPKAPVNFYGLTKLEGENEVTSLLKKYFIVRTSWVFGLNGKNFVRTMLRLGAENESVKVVCDQIGSPTYTYDLAGLLCDMISTEKYGVYHATNEGFCAWSDFAAAIMKEGGLSCRVLPIPSSEYVSKAVRPFNSRMSKDKLTEAGFSRLPSWQDALHRYVAELKDSEKRKA